MSAVLVIDVGTSSVRSAVVGDDASVGSEATVALLPSSPEPGLVEFDAAAMARAALDVAGRALASHDGPVDAVGVSNQRGSTVVWDRATGEPVGPGLGWQDLRTVFTCLEMKARGLRLAPNMSATKVAWLLDTYDADRSRDLCFGTVDTWIAWTLSGGAVHATDATNAGITGLTTAGGGWSTEVLDALRIPAGMMPEVVDTYGVAGEATVLPGSPPLAALVGDQQASLVGQGGVRPGLAKATFGTGGMLDVCVGPERPDFEVQGPAGTFPIVAWRRGGADVWGLEAVMLAAGTNIEWLRDDLGIIATAAESHHVAAACDDTGGVVYVPALLGLGTPRWDYGARGTMLGLTRGSGRPEVVRAVLEGIAQRGVDLIEAVEADASLDLTTLRIDGGMSENPTFVQALADAARRPVEVSPQREATTLGAGLLAGLAVGVWTDLDGVAATWHPRAVVEPRAERAPDRDRWKEAVERAAGWIPDLSAVEF